MNDQPFNTDFTPAPRPTPGEPAQLEYDPYDDGLNPARGIMNGLLMGVGLLIALYVLYLAADHALTAFIGG